MKLIVENPQAAPRVSSLERPPSPSPSLSGVLANLRLRLYELEKPSQGWNGEDSSNSCRLLANHGNSLYTKKGGASESEVSEATPPQESLETYHAAAWILSVGTQRIA